MTYTGRTPFHTERTTGFASAPHRAIGDQGARVDHRSVQLLMTIFQHPAAVCRAFLEMGDLVTMPGSGVGGTL
jgi:hypothetical protein